MLEHISVCVPGPPRFTPGVQSMTRSSMKSIISAFVSCRLNLSSINESLYEDRTAEERGKKL